MRPGNPRGTMGVAENGRNWPNVAEPAVPVAQPDPTDDGLSALEAKAVAAILNTRTLQEASDSCDVPYRTLWRWLRDDRFAKALRRAKRSILDAATGRSVQLVAKALDTLDAIMDDAEAPGAVRVRAAAVALQTALNVTALADLEAEVMQLRADREAEAAARARELAQARGPVAPAPEAHDANDQRRPVDPEAGDGPDESGP